MIQPKPLPPPVLDPVIAYATPLAYRDNAIWCEGDQLMVHRFVSLPPRCVKCNNDVLDGWRWRKKMYWHPPGLFVMLLFPILWIVFGIVVLCTRQKAMVEASLCSEHRARIRKWAAVTWIMLLSVFVLIVAGIVSVATIHDGMWMAICGFVGIIPAITALLAGNRARVLRPTKMAGDFAWLKGACPEFLSSFPATGQ